MKSKDFVKLSLLSAMLLTKEGKPFQLPEVKEIGQRKLFLHSPGKKRHQDPGKKNLIKRKRQCY